MTMIELVLALAVAVNRATDWFKQQFLDRLTLTEPQRNAILLLVSAAFGVFGALGLQANLFADNPVYGQLPPLAGQLLTGVLAGAGANAIHAIWDILNVRRATVVAIEVEPEPEHPARTFLRENTPPAEPKA